ncbi:OmpA family protein, partial [Bacteroidales bacterium OttesenSCG-928-A14]|nr:OmpA family protein [Bacteroidales bacterium OttesenSCG-928-A14]
MRNAYFLIPLLSLFALSCSSSKTITRTNASFTEKDEIMINSNSSFPIASVVGGGGELAKIEKERIFAEMITSRNEKIGNINGLSLREIDSANYIAEVNNDILFATNSFDLTSDAMEILSELAAIINETSNTSVQVIGYTDNTGTPDYNLALSNQRAITVGSFLKMQGVENVSEIGMGLENPVASNKTSEGRRKNRRVEIKLSA